jgi:hypothetical protein
MDSFAFSRIIDMIMYGLFSIIILVYYFIPTPARHYWISRFKQISSRLNWKRCEDEQCAVWSTRQNEFIIIFVYDVIMYGNKLFGTQQLTESRLYVHGLGDGLHQLLPWQDVCQDTKLILLYL